MAIMAGEAIEAGGQRGMARASAKRRRPRAGRGEQLRSRRVTRRTPIDDDMGGTETETETYGPRSGRGGGLGGAYANQARAVGRGAQLAPGRPGHQGAILAEFIVCILILSIAPIATGGSGTGLSPYSANDLKRFAAIGAVYFGLALIPGDNGSRVAAWLGGLVMLVVLMNTLKSGDLVKVLGIFSQGGTTPPGATTTGTG